MLHSDEIKCHRTVEENNENEESSTIMLIAWLSPNYNIWWDKNYINLQIYFNKSELHHLQVQ